jgi:hypothetical protein
VSVQIFCSEIKLSETKEKKGQDFYAHQSHTKYGRKIQTRSLWFEKVLPTKCKKESGGGLEFAH